MVPRATELPRRPPRHYTQPFHYAQMQFLSFLLIAILTGNLLFSWFLNLLWWIRKSRKKPRHSDKYVRASCWMGLFIFLLVAVAKL